MKTGGALYLLAGLVTGVSCQKPTVQPFPKFSVVYAWDELTLVCLNTANTADVRWTFNSQPVKNNPDFQVENGRLHIKSASDKHTGAYSCQAGGTQSDAYTLSVKKFRPPAQLVLTSSWTVTHVGDRVEMLCEVGGDSRDWAFKIYRKPSKVSGRDRQLRIEDLTPGPDGSLQYTLLNAPKNYSATFWCEHKDRKLRSNAVVIKSSDTMVILEASGDPMSLGNSVILVCRVWGGAIISKVIFYKDENSLQVSKSANLEIKNKKEDYGGMYYCEATYKFKGNTGGREITVKSEMQELIRGVEVPIAVLSLDRKPLEASESRSVSEGSSLSLSCSCSECPSGTKYRLYRDRHPHLAPSEGPWTVSSEAETHSFRCTALWEDGASAFSHSLTVESASDGVASSVLIMVVVVLILIGVAIIVFVVLRRRRTPEPVYQDVPLTAVKSGPEEGKYQTLEESRKKEGEYETIGLAKEGEGGKKEGEGGYEALRKAKGQKGGEYETLEQKGGGGERDGGKKEGEGGYEALRKAKGQKGEEYETLEQKGGGGEREGGKKEGEGGYEPLLQGRPGEREYETLKQEANKE